MHYIGNFGSVRDWLRSLYVSKKVIIITSTLIVSLAFSLGLTQMTFQGNGHTLKLQKPTKEMLDLMYFVHQKFGLPYSIVYAQIKKESGFNPHAQSKYAQGLCQFRPSTFKQTYEELETLYDFNLEPNIWNIRSQIICYGYYMAEVIPRELRHFGIKDNIENRLRGYNAGPKNAEKSKAKNWADGETNDYVDKIKNHSNKETIFATTLFGTVIISEWK